LLLGACSRKDDYVTPVLGTKPTSNAGAAGSGLPSFPITGINSNLLTVTGVEPGSGPFSGGTTAVVRGSGFADDATVRVGDMVVLPTQISRDGTNRISIVVPAGTVGPADVTVTQGDNTVTLTGGYVYNGLSVSPGKGAAAGGSLVEITLSGATFGDDSVVAFDGQACSELDVDAPQHATCKTPPHDPATVDVTASKSGSASPVAIGRQSYEYAETLDAANGGLSGGAIAGTINITVLSDGGTGNVIPQTLIMVGNDPRTALHGYTNQRGSITFSKAGLVGPVTVHASAKCFERTSIVDLDATDVTLFLSPSLDPSCAAPGDLSPGAKQLASTVSGQLVFPGVQEFDINSWSIVPAPKDGEMRVAYVYTTRASLDVRNPEPDGVDGEIARIVEDTAVTGTHGYVYRISARPGGLAVYALAGIERNDDHTFTPYVMGIAHNVVTSPGQENHDVDLSMTITLDRELDVTLSGLSQPSADGPNEYRARAYVDLGGEGLIVRDVNGVSFDTLINHSAGAPFRFIGQPAFVEGLANASYYVIAGFYTPDTDIPFTSQKRTGVRQSDTPLAFTNFLGIPNATAPALGAAIPDDRILRFSVDGTADPDLITVELADGSGFPVWSFIVPGNEREVPIPDLSQLKGETDIATGFIQWEVTAAKIDDFSYNQFQYTYLSSRYWTHTSQNVFFARH
jgi:hypothetical protein